MKYTSLEHLVLESLYDRSNIIIERERKSTGAIPLYSRQYVYPQFHFGFLVDTINSPKKYKDVNLLETRLEDLNPTEEEIRITKYGYMDVADAIEVLIENKHVDEVANATLSGKVLSRKIKVTPNGILAYRKKFYIKEAAQELFVQRGYTIQKTDYFLKRYWFIIAICSFLFGYFIDITKPSVSKAFEQKTEMPKANHQ